MIIITNVSKDKLLIMIDDITNDHMIIGDYKLWWLIMDNCNSGESGDEGNSKNKYKYDDDYK